MKSLRRSMLRRPSNMSARASSPGAPTGVRGRSRASARNAAAAATARMPHATSMPRMPSRCASSGVAMMPARMPRYIERVPSPEAVARSPGGNQRAASFVMAPSTNGWPTAMTICPAKTSARFAANNPRPRQPMAVSTAPMPTAGRKPHVSMAHAAGRNITT